MRNTGQTARRDGKRDPRRDRARSHAAKLRVALADLSGPERDTMRVRVYRSLARGLMAGMFKPGEAVTLRTLAKRLGTSAMPVREAVSRLIAERALVLLPNRSVIVPRMSRERFIELTETRQVLEGMVTEAACARATPALLRKLSEINDAMKASITANDFHGALSHNVAFHFTLYQAAAKPVALALIEMLWLQAGPFLALSLTTPAVLAALRASQATAARRAVEADIEETSSQLLKKAIFEDSPAPATTGNHLLLVSSH
jgi:DNA-binding GntR family transcriptional regulator